VKPHKFFLENIFIALSGPFSFIDWVLVSTSVFLLAATFKLTGFGMQHGMFWIVTLIMEKRNYSSDQITSKNKPLIISWLLAAFLFRNFYTSDLYSYMTKQPKAMNLPKSFKQIILNHTLPIISTVSHLDYLTDVVRYDKTFGECSLPICKCWPSGFCLASA